MADVMASAPSLTRLHAKQLAAAQLFTPVRRTLTRSTPAFLSKPSPEASCWT
jgi:hypothetical protein